MRISQLDQEIAQFSTIKYIPLPSEGWINTFRTAIGMSLKQLGNKLGITAQGAKDLERREMDGSITLQKLKETAAALDMQLLYGLLPNEGTLERMVERRALQLAKEIIIKTAQTTSSEKDEIDQTALNNAIEKSAARIKRELPKQLWD